MFSISCRLIIALTAISSKAASHSENNRPLKPSAPIGSPVHHHRINKMSTFLKYLDRDATFSSVLEDLASSPLTLVVAVASFAPQCKSLLAELADLESDYHLGGAAHSCCEPVVKPNVLVIRTDEADELEDLAIELGMDGVPSFQVYRVGRLVGGSSGGKKTVALDAIRALLNAAKSSSSARPAVCCPDGSASAPTDPSAVLRLVQRSYADAANRSGGGCCVSVDPRAMGYTPEQIIRAGKDSNLGLGCGNPISFANIRPGETVVDLGSGAGVDCFLASALVGSSGRVIGVDMTPDMLYRARRNASDRDCANVSFRLGEIEHLPVPDGTADCVISNCVVNLSPDKPQVFREAHRILKPGGRLAVADVVVRPRRSIPERLKTAEALACWVSGAPETASLEAYLREAGFEEVELKLKEESREVISQWLPGSGAEDFVIGAEIMAKKRL